MGIGEGQKTFSNGRTDMRGCFSWKHPINYKKDDPTVEENNINDEARKAIRIIIYKLIAEGKNNQEIKDIIEGKYSEQGIKIVIRGKELTLKLPWNGDQLWNQIDHCRKRPKLGRKLERESNGGDAR